VEERVVTRYTGKISECLAGLFVSESVSGAWEELRDVTVNAADAVCFDEECKQVTN
jgi:hypothetical protein